jgi:hypothetical protein
MGARVIKSDGDSVVILVFGRKSLGRVSCELSGFLSMYFCAFVLGWSLSSRTAYVIEAPVFGMV